MIKTGLTHRLGFRIEETLKEDPEKERDWGRLKQDAFDHLTTIFNTEQRTAWEHLSAVASGPGPMGPLARDRAVTQLALGNLPGLTPLERPKRIRVEFGANDVTYVHEYAVRFAQGPGGNLTFPTTASDFYADSVSAKGLDIPLSSRMRWSEKLAPIAPPSPVSGEDTGSEPLPASQQEVPRGNG